MECRRPRSVAAIYMCLQRIFHFNSRDFSISPERPIGTVCLDEGNVKVIDAAQGNLNQFA